MPASSEAATPPVRVTVSAPLELMWLIHWAGADHEHKEFAQMEVLRREFRGELDRLWEGASIQYSTEMLVLAYRSGTFLDPDLKRFFARLDATIAEEGPLPSLQSESPDEREMTQRRLDRLRTDAAFRKRYTELLRRIWAEVTADWESTGHTAAEAEAQRWSAALEGGAPFRQLLKVQHIWPPRPEIDSYADVAAAGGRLVMTPSWFGGHIHVLELDGTVYVGRGLRIGEPSMKQVATEIATSIKALADPTRLAILLRLAREPASVTEMARQLQLSQPTVSAHVQVLREAGLLEEKTVGRSALLSASEEGLHRLFAHAEESLVQAFRF